MVVHDVQGETVQVWFVDILHDHRYKRRLKSIEKKCKKKYK